MRQWHTPCASSSCFVRRVFKVLYCSQRAQSGTCPKWRSVLDSHMYDTAPISAAARNRSKLFTGVPPVRSRMRMAAPRPVHSCSLHAAPLRQ